MPRIIYVEHEGAVHSLAVPSGHSVMQGAVDNNVPGIDAECGGECACGTCLIYVDAAWCGRISLLPAGSEEATILGFANRSRPESRLSCQIQVSEALDGLVVHLPESQR